MSEVVQALKDWREHFLQNLRVRGYSLRTVGDYRGNLERFFRWLLKQPPMVSPGELTSTLLRKYQADLMTATHNRYKHPRVLTAGARSNHLSALKSFFHYLRKSGRILSNPAADLERPKVGKKIPREILSIAEMFRLLHIVDATSDIGIHDLAVLELLYSTGLRRSEFLWLQLRDLRLEEGFVHVLGKGNKERVVPVGSEAIRALRRYLQTVRPKWVQGDCPYVFVSQFLGKNMRGNCLLARIRRYAKAAKITKAISFHGFRHACATHLLQGKADLRAIQLILGHDELNVTAQYLRVDPTLLRQTILRHHPRETQGLPGEDETP